MEQKEKTLLKTILVAFYSNPEYVSPLIDTITILSKDYKVIVVARDVGNFNYDYPKNVVLYKIGPRCEISNYNIPFYKKIMGYTLFILKIFCLIKSENIALLFLYDARALIAGGIASCLSKNPPIVYHQCVPNLLEEIPKNSFFYWVKYLEFYFSRFVSVISCTEPTLAKLFLKESGLRKEIIVVQNCSRKVMQVPNPAFQLQKLKSEGYKIVLHRGPIGGIDIEATIRSMKFWPSNAILVLVGLYTDQEEAKCNEISKEEGVENKIIFIPFVSTQEELFKYTVAADIGLVLYKINKRSDKYIAPTKLYDYIACGVPVVVPNKMTFISRLVKKLNIGFVYEEATQEEIGKAIRTLLELPERVEMGKRAREVHLTTLNYETQFIPLYEKIKTIILKNKK